MDLTPSQIAIALKKARSDAGMSQGAVAARLGVDPMTLSRWERGLRRPPRASTLLLAKIYRRDPEEFGETPESLGETSSEAGRASDLALPHAPAKRGAELEASLQLGGAHVTADLTTGPGPRHARNLPLAVREYLAEFQLRLVKGGASEDEIDEAMALLRSPDVFSYFKGGKLAEYNEEDVLDGMRSLAEDVVIPRLQKLGRKVK